MGWHEEHAAKICASKSLQLWMQSTNQGLEHPRTMFFFGNAILYSQLFEFGLSDKPLSAYPELQAEVAKLALSWIIDISIESKHTIAKARIATAGHNISQPYFSTALRQHEIEDFVDHGLAEL